MTLVTATKASNLFFMAKDKNGDWAETASDSVESVVSLIRDKAVMPIVTVARGVVFGLLALILAVAVTVLFIIAAQRILNVYIPGDDVWPADLIIGGVFTAIGLLFWNKSRPKTV